MAEAASSSAAWRSPLGEIGPAPEGQALTVSVRCQTRKGSTGRFHDVVIASDWSVTTPHDLDAERIGVALGGYLSCITLVDSTIPAFRDQLQLLARRELPPIGRNAAGRWTVTTPTNGCACGRLTFESPREAAVHARSPKHLAARYGATPQALQRLVEAGEAAHGGFAMCPPPGWHALSLVQEPRGLDTLWDAGVPPEFIEHVHDTVLPAAEPLATATYLGAAFHCTDLAWLAATVAPVPEPEVALWAAWAQSEQDRLHPRLRESWLRVGVPRSAIDALVNGAVEVGEARVLAEVTGRSVLRASLVLAGWELAGCRPGPGDIAALDSVGLGDVYVPSGGVIQQLYASTRNLRVPPTRTQIAVLLGLVGTRDAALSLLRHGVVTTEQALEVVLQSAEAPRWNQQMKAGYK